MLNELDGADNNNQAKVFDLMIHGICRGWLPAPHQSSYDRENFRLDNEGAELSPITHAGLRTHRFSGGVLVPAAIAIVAVAAIASRWKPMPCPSQPGLWPRRMTP